MCPCIRRINAVKMITLTKALHGFPPNAIEIPMPFFTDIGKTTQKFV